MLFLGVSYGNLHCFGMELVMMGVMSNITRVVTLIVCRCYYVDFGLILL